MALCRSVNKIHLSSIWQLTRSSQSIITQSARHGGARPAQSRYRRYPARSWTRTRACWREWPTSSPRLAGRSRPPVSRARPNRGVWRTGARALRAQSAGSICRDCSLARPLLTYYSSPRPFSNGIFRPDSAPSSFPCARPLLPSPDRSARQRNQPSHSTVLAPAAQQDYLL